MPRVIVCDVNETLLDVGALEPHFKQTFGDGRVLQEWFANVLLYSEVATLAGPYSDFASIGGAALDMVASARGITLSAADRSRILQGMLTLPPHPDVREGLQTMRDAGLRLVTLTNSAPAAVQQQLTNAGLTAFFERSFSMDTVRRFKPAAEAYRSVADSLGLPVDRLRLVAAHAWDVVGRAPSGMRRSLRRPTGESPLSARSEAGHHWTGFSRRREAGCSGRISPSLIAARRRLIESRVGGQLRNRPSGSVDASLAPSPSFRRPAHRETPTSGARRLCGRRGARRTRIP